VVNAEDSRSEPPWTWVQIPASPKKIEMDMMDHLMAEKLTKNNKDNGASHAKKKLKKFFLPWPRCSHYDVNIYKVRFNLINFAALPPVIFLS